MGINRQLAAIEQGFKIVRSFPEWQRTPIILGESDPEGCAGCSAQDHPQNLYRNGPLYGAYTVDVLNNILQLARREHVNLVGAVTWAFEFEDQPPFAGFRELATNGVDKAVLNAFRMLGLLGNDQVKASSSGALPGDQIVRAGVRAQPDINVIATRKDPARDNDQSREIEILIWNYHDDDIPFRDAPIDLVVNGLPANAKRLLLEHFRVDSNHSNAFAAWKLMGSPQSLSASQLESLESTGQLQLLNSPAWTTIHETSVRLQFMLPRQGISLLRLAW
jgi:xylan 1,4-beta-xylosidase